MRWKNANNELPDLAQESDYSVIVRFENGSIEIVHVEDWIRDNNCEHNFKITHWMHLPEQPREGDEK